MKGNVSKAKGGSGGGGVTVADGKVYATDGETRIELMQAYQTYGVSIDLSNSNPETSVTYTDDAVGMVAGSPDWYKMSIFKNIKPCLFKDGAVVGYLNPDNFAQFADGTAADITSGNSGDVMIEIPKTGYKIAKSGTTLTVQITDDPNKEGFSYKAHTRTEEGDREKLYIGAFLTCERYNMACSISGQEPINSPGLFLSDFRAEARAKGEGYDILGFYPLTLLQCLYLIFYKNLNSQTALGMGCVSGGNVKNTGATVDKGMNYGTSDPEDQIKFLGIEDFWGNLSQCIDGLMLTEECLFYTATDNFNDTGEGYTYVGKPISPIDVSGYMTLPFGTNDLGFIIEESGGSSSTYFSDRASFNSNGYDPSFGGNHAWAESGGGAFSLCFDIYRNSPKNDYTGSRLMFL